MAARFVSEEPHRVAPEHVGAELASPARQSSLVVPNLDTFAEERGPAVIGDRA